MYSADDFYERSLWWRIWASNDLSTWSEPDAGGVRYRVEFSPEVASKMIEEFRLRPKRKTTKETEVGIVDLGEI